MVFFPPMSQFFASCGQSIGVSASISYYLHLKKHLLKDQKEDASGGRSCQESRVALFTAIAVVVVPPELAALTLARCGVPCLAYPPILLSLSLDS